jgi:hypothetical protein
MLGRVGLGSILRVHDIYLRELPAATTIMEMKRVSAACEPGKRPIDLVTSTATSQLLAMASCGDGLDSRGILGTTAAGKVAKPVMPARMRPPGDKQCEGGRGIMSATMRPMGGRRKQAAWE